MTPHEATRTLVKSPPEVWAQCSDAEALDRHLNGSFGEIRITRLEPETAVAWEGEQVRGTVRIEPSAWGTRVTLTAQVEGEPAEVASGPPAAAAVLTKGPPEAVEVAEPPPPPVEVAEPPPIPEDELAEIQAEPVEPLRDESVTAESPAVDRPAGLWARLTRRFRAAPPEPEPEPEPEPVAASPEPDPEPAVTPEPDEQYEPPALPALAEAPEPHEPPALPALAEEPKPPEHAVDPGPPPEASSEPAPPSRSDPTEVLSAALDSLGQAHHRPFSRA